jgi:P27 family predicted phage terminase small subunit
MPIEIKQRLGDPGHRLPKDARSAEIGESITPTAPPLDLPPEGQELWMEVLPVLANYGGLRSVDLPALKGMCQLWAMAERAQQTLNEQGYFTQGSTGQMVAHPAYKIVLETRAAFLKHAEQFGLTWIARSRLGLNEATRHAVLAGLEGKLGANPRG